VPPRSALSKMALLRLAKLKIYSGIGTANKRLQGRNPLLLQVSKV
jgi:hypothetical protein